MTAPTLTPAPALAFPSLLLRGLAAGGIAGAAAALVSLIVVERPLEDALAVEEAASAGAHEHAEELFSRPTQIVGGMVTALVVASAIGLVFAVVFAKTRHRLPVRTDFGRAMLLATAGFATVAFVPGLKYPADPPGVGAPGTITSRTLLWASFVGAMLVVAYLAFVAREKVTARGWEPAYRDAAVGAGVLVVVVALALVWPPIAAEIPAGMPASVLWRFRVASLLELASLWIVLGMSLGLLLTRAARR